MKTIESQKFWFYSIYIYIYIYIDNIFNLLYHNFLVELWYVFVLKSLSLSFVCVFVSQKKKKNIKSKRNLIFILNTNLSIYHILT